MHFSPRIEPACLAMESHMVLAKQDLLKFFFALKVRKRKRQENPNDEFNVRDYLRLQEELRMAREKARLFDLLHRNRVF
jgi:hypothetical protein